MLFLSAASAVITLMAQRSAERTFREIPLGIRIENAVVAYGLYLWKMLWPARLAALYPHPANTLPMWQVTLSALVLVGMTTLAVTFRDKRYLPVGWFWFLGTLVPVIGLVQAGQQAMADRFAYIPLIGIFVMIAWSLDDWAAVRKVRVVWRVIPALCALTALSFATSRQMTYWESDNSLWSHTLEVAESPFAHNEAGATLMHADQDADTVQTRMDEARRHFERSLELCRQLTQQNPSAYLGEMATALSNLGTVDLFQNRMDQARQHYEEALKTYRQLAQQAPDMYRRYVAGTLNNLGSLDRNQNRFEESHVHYTEALTIYRTLVQNDPEKYAGDVARVEASLQELDTKVNSR